MKNNDPKTLIEKSYTYPDSGIRVEFDCTPNDTKLFDVDKEGHIFSLSTQNLSTKKAPHVCSNIHGDIEHAFPFADVSYIAGEHSIGIDIIIQKNVENTFSFVLSSQTLAAKRVESDHQILLYDTNTKTPIFAIIDPIVLDYKNHIGPSVCCNVEWIDNHQMQFTYCLDRNWLEAEKRSFPVKLRAQIISTNTPHPIVAQFEDFSPSDLSFHTGLRHYYAPLLETNGSAKEPLGLKMNLGKGWGLNLLQSIKPVTQSLKVTSFNYQDGEHLQTILFKSDEKIDKNSQYIESDEEDDYDEDYYYNPEYYNCGFEFEQRYCNSNNNPQNIYYYKSKDGLLTYNPKTRVLQKRNERLSFDINGRLIRIVDSNNHSLCIFYRDGRISEIFGGLLHSFRFAYSEDDYLVAIINSYNQWVRYDYVEGYLHAARFSSGQELFFPTSSASNNELTVRMKKDISI